MRLLNFSLPSADSIVSVCAHGLEWDLHNLAVYSGMTIGTDGTVTLEWIVFENPYRPEDYKFGGCAFVFRGLRVLTVVGRDSDMPESEDVTLHGIFRILQNDSTPYLTSKMRNEWTPETPFRLMFEFRGGLFIEIDAEEVEFLTRPKAAVT